MLLVTRDEVVLPCLTRVFFVSRPLWLAKTSQVQCCFVWVLSTTLKGSLGFVPRSAKWGNGIVVPFVRLWQSSSRQGCSVCSTRGRRGQLRASSRSGPGADADSGVHGTALRRSTDANGGVPYTSPAVNAAPVPVVKYTARAPDRSFVSGGIHRASAC